MRSSTSCADAADPAKPCAGRPVGAHRTRRPAPWQARVSALVTVFAGCVGCSQSDQFLAAQIDHQLRKHEPPSLDLGQVGPAKWARACVLAPYTDDARAAALLGFPWPAARNTSIDRRDDIAVLVFTEGERVLAFVERSRGDGDFTGVQPPCVTRAAPQLTTRRDAAGRLLIVRPAPDVGGR